MSQLVAARLKTKNHLPTPEEIPKAQQWQNADELRWTVRGWATRMNVRVPQIHLRVMRTKWASISRLGRLTLNLELLDLPKEIGEFVIVHELAHLLVPNHGRVFKLMLDAYMPDWKEREELLRKFEQRQQLKPTSCKP